MKKYIRKLANRNIIGKINDVAFRKRFAKSNAWFQWMIAQLKPKAVIHYPKPNLLMEYHVKAVDASHVTEQSTGEPLKNFQFQKKDLILAD